MEVTELQAKKSELETILSKLVETLFDLSMDATLLERADGESEQDFRTRLFKAQEDLEDRAKKMKIELDLLFVRDFKDRTDEFEQAYTDLKVATDSIDHELEKLEALVATMRQINQVLKLVDQAIVIAAGLAKSV